MSIKANVSWIAAGALGAGLAYFYSRRALRDARSVPTDEGATQHSTKLNALDESVDVDFSQESDLGLDVDFSEPISVTSSEITIEGIQEISSAEIPIELVTDEKRTTEEPYDTVATENLGSEYLVRATEATPRPQIPDSIEAALNGVWAADEENVDDTDFAGRPTDPMIDVSSIEHPSEMPPSGRMVRQPGPGRALASNADWEASEGWELPEDRK